MTTATNPITGDLIKTKGSNDAYRDGWERIFGNKKEEKPVKSDQPEKVENENASK